jgi:energy-coupling factor transporter ATP-binding protein EcfA2
MQGEKMKLHSITYTEYENETYAWILDELSLIDINLIVGKNATGKSRVLRIINGLARLIEGTLQPANISSGRYTAIFKDRPPTTKKPKKLKPDITYSLDINGNKVTKEILQVGEVIKLNRGKDGRGSLYFEKNQSEIDVKIPEHQVGASVRRDSQQHDFFEELHLWANTVRYFEFSKATTNAFTSFEENLTIDALGLTPLQDNLHLVVKFGKERFRRDFSSSVISDMRKIGYNITDFGLTPAVGIASPIQSSNAFQTLFVMETGIEKKLAQIEISDGMLRALATLIHLHFIRLQKKFGCVLIDDIGEGLDFDRATKLISVIIDMAESGFMQLAMTSNDRFVMNKVPLNYWSILQRVKGKVTAINPRNSPTKFTEFEEFGFNNFDFFAKDFFSTGVFSES